MSIQGRSWLALAAVIAVAQGVLALLSILQHEALLSDLVRQRLSVVAQTTAVSFQPIVDLGLPLAMVRGGDAIAARALDTDPDIRAVHVFNPSGIIVYSSSEDRPEAVSPEVLRALRLASGAAWSLESRAELQSGYTIRRGGDPVGAVLIAYPKDQFEQAVRAMAVRTVRLAILLWAALSAIAYVVLRLFLAAPVRRLAEVEALATADRTAAPTAPEGPAGRAAGSGLFGDEIARLETNLGRARQAFEDASAALPPFGGEGGAPPRKAAPPPRSTTVEQMPGRSLARAVAQRVAPPAALLIIVGAVVLGLVTVRDVTRSVEPELAARTALIGTIVSENVERAVSAGVPLDNLVGAEKYFGAMLTELPEVAYIAVATGRIVLEAGERIDPYLAPPRARKEVRSHPIMHRGEEIAYVIIDIDPAFITERFRAVFLDFGVIALVTIFIAFEIMILLTSRSLTAALDRLQHLAAMQAAGDFSSRMRVAARSGIDRLTALLVERAEVLDALFAAGLDKARAAGDPARLRGELDAIGRRFGLSTGGHITLRFPYFTDMRLALFLFAAADELPLSFLPLYTRAADNPWGWLDQSVVISLPLAGYLAAILLVTPYARALSAWLGHRRLMILAALPTLAAHFGLYLATTVPEIVLYRTVTGFGYALVTLACQDYVLDLVGKDQRDSSLGLFGTVLFGGIFCGTALGGVLADRLGQSTTFLVSTGLIVLSALLIARFLSPIDAGTGGRTTHQGAPRLWAPLGDRRFAALVFGIAIPANVLLQAYISYLVALTLDGLGASTADIGRTLMLYFLAIALVGPFAGRAAETRFPAACIALAGALLSGAALLVGVLWPGQMAIAAAVLGAGIGHGMTRGAQVSVAMAIADADLARLGPDVVLAALRTLERGGSIVGLIAIAMLAGVAGYTNAALAVSLWVLGGAALYALLGIRAGHPMSARA